MIVLDASALLALINAEPGWEVVAREAAGNVATISAVNYAEVLYPAELARDLGLTRSNVSNHLACLRDCGIAVAVPQGRQTRYEVADPHLSRALTALIDLTLAVDEDAPCLDPACSAPGCDTEAGA